MARSNLTEEQRKQRRGEPRTKGAYELLVDAYEEAELNDRLRQATSLERRLYENTGLEPGLDRAAFLPIAGSRDEGNLEFATPAILYDLIKAGSAPGAAAKGTEISPEEIAETGMNITTGGLGISHFAGPAVTGPMLGMAVKRKGGNWLKNEIANETKHLKFDAVDLDQLNAPEGVDLDQILDAFIRGVDPTEYTGFDDPDLAIDIINYVRNTYPDVYAKSIPPHERAVDKWIDTKLNKYIQNEMATPEDPMRILADDLTRSTHLDRWEDEYTSRLIKYDRKEAGFPEEGYANTQRGRNWETVGDAVIRSEPARFADAEDVLKDNPWLKRINPDDPVYGLDEDAPYRLGFDVVVDELRRATDPDSTLPQHLRIDPDKLDRMTVPQISEKVGDIKSWGREQARKAELEALKGNLQATPKLEDPNFNLDFVDKPGGKWVEIPDTRYDETGLKLCTSIGKAGGWCTMDEDTAKNYGSSYGSRGKKLTALLDAEGRPHVQIQSWGNDIPEIKPVGNSLNSAQASEYKKRDSDYKNKISQSVLNYLNANADELQDVYDLNLFSIKDTRNATFRGKSLEEFFPKRFVTQEEFSDTVFSKIDDLERDWGVIDQDYSSGGKVNTPINTPTNYSTGRWRLI